MARSFKIVHLPLLLLGFFVIAGCGPADESQLQTMMAPALSTAAAEAGQAAQTQGVGWGQTVIASGETEAAQIRETSVAAALTQAAAALPPQPPGIDYEHNDGDIILYNVVRSLSVAQVADKFSIPGRQIIALNKEKYPAITSESSRLEIDWRLVLYVGSPDQANLIPQSNDAWQDIPGCIEGQGQIISVVTCNEYTLDFIKEWGFNSGCSNLRGNPLGSYFVRSRYKGLMLYHSGEPFVYSLYFDEEERKALIGPAIIQDKINQIECRIP